MARETEIRYISYYMVGSAAYDVEPRSIKKEVKLPKQRRKGKIVLHVDPMAVMGICVAFVMFVLMIVGAVRLGIAQKQADRMANYVVSLQAQNAELREEYERGYDLEEIRQIAEARGMIPISEAQQVSIQIVLPETAKEPTAWESFVTFLTGLFA